MTDKKYIINEFKKIFPNEAISEDELFFDFFSFIKRNFPTTDEEVQNNVKLFYEFVNEVSENTSNNSINLIEVAILEVLTDEKIWQDLSFKHLKGNALKIFENLFVSKFTRFN